MILYQNILRDDPTLGGILNLLESLFDQAKINEQDFDYLIHAFNEIHCYEGIEAILYGERLGSDQFDNAINNSLILNDN
ncbi:unnamed protein product [Rotaria sordida]|uniref:Uncharacterized protein n=1 Tax=Rotaria sordida TaxID=392033 RepID=A0A813S241_9BILA|nr:unnamed protein product [Rotaria sordida]CAF0789072.1 unnamed protein product [Rotaria sordida]